MTRSLGLFEGYGIEIESMVVDADTLEVRSIVDLLLREFAGSDEWVGDVEAGEIAISNEFVAHVVELKTNGPAKSYSGLESEFRGCSTRLNELLREWNARLLPTAMHPWMNPVAETEFWSHDNSPIYRAYHALFDARRHGWANLQSVHLNLPFADEREFAKLMAAIRLVLPLIPALAASSPIVEGNATGMLDNRLHFYRTNSERVSAMTGEVIPEAIFDVETYRKVVLGAIDVQLKERGASQVLMGNEWTNARGAIARFDRMAIEIRLIDAQENALADLAIAEAVSQLVQSMVEERWMSFEDQCAFSSKPLVNLLIDTIERGPDAELASSDFVRALGGDPAKLKSVGALLRHLIPDNFEGAPEARAALDVVLEQGTLSQRILQRLGTRFDRDACRELYRELADCLDSGRIFLP